MQCEKWCPKAEAVFSSVQAAQPGQQKKQQPASPSAPQWGWDDLKFSAGDTLNPGTHPYKIVASPSKMLFVSFLTFYNYSCTVFPFSPCWLCRFADSNNEDWKALCTVVKGACLVLPISICV